MLTNLVERFGCNAVWHVGIDILGFPPSWNPTMSEVKKLQDELERIYPNGLHVRCP